MTKVIVVAWALAVMACAIEPNTSSTDQKVCTIEDQQNDTCPPDSGQYQYTERYGRDVSGPDAAGMFGACDRAVGYLNCHGYFDLPGARLFVWCHFNDLGGGVHCGYDIQPCATCQP